MFKKVLPPRQNVTVEASNRPEDSLRPVMLFGDKAYLTTLTYGETKTYYSPVVKSRLSMWAAILGLLAPGVCITTICLSWGVPLFSDPSNLDSAGREFGEFFNGISPLFAGLGAGIVTWGLGFSVCYWIHSRRVQTESKATRERFTEQVGDERFALEVPLFEPRSVPIRYISSYDTNIAYRRISFLECLAREIHRNKAKLSRGTPGRSPNLPVNAGNHAMAELTSALVVMYTSTDMHERGRLSVRMYKLYVELEAVSKELEEAANRAHYG